MAEEKPVFITLSKNQMKIMNAVWELNRYPFFREDIEYILDYRKSSFTTGINSLLDLHYLRISELPGADQPGNKGRPLEPTLSKAEYFSLAFDTEEERTEAALTLLQKIRSPENLMEVQEESGRQLYKRSNTPSAVKKRMEAERKQESAASRAEADPADRKNGDQDRTDDQNRE